MEKVSGVVIPGFTPAVRWFRFRNAAQRMGVPEIDLYGNKNFQGDYWAEAMAEYFAKHGTKWDFLWTNLYTDAMQAILSAMKELGADIVVDVDDLFSAVPKGNLAYSHWHGKGRQDYMRLIQEADRVVTSTPFLAGIHGAKVGPNYIEPAQWDWAERPTKDPSEVVILFSGGNGRAGDYMESASAIKDTLDLPNTKMVFMGAFPEWALDYPAGKAIWCRWVDIKDYPRMLKWISPDIVVSPMEHNDFNLAKSNLKWLEAAAIGSTFVGENWGEYARTVVDQETGVLCDGDWAERLRWICTDHDERRKIAEQGRAEMLKNWTWEAVGKDWRAAVLGESTHANDHGSTGH